MIGLVTGAARGIGLEVCRQLAARGWIVILTARTRLRAVSAADAIDVPGATIDPRELDVTNDASIRTLTRALMGEYGHIDCLVNNAAVVADWTETPSGADLANARAVFDVNLFGTWRVTQAMLPLLRASHHARIVMVSSGAGSHADPQFGLPTSGSVASYGVSKAALNALTTKFAVELERSRILVNAVCPGLTATAPGMEAIGARPVSEGAASVVWAATLADDGPTGGFFRDGQPLGW